MNGVFVISYVGLWTLVLLESIAVFALYQHFGQMYLNSREGREKQGPAVGSSFSRMAVTDLTGASVGLPVPKTPMLVVFVSTTCQPCQRLLPELANFARTRHDIATLLICAGERDAVCDWAKDIRGTLQVVADPSYGLAAHYQVGVTPFCIGVDRYGTVRAKGLVNDFKGLEFAARDVLLGAHLDKPIDVLQEA